MATRGLAKSDDLIGTDGKRESRESMLLACLDDDKTEIHIHGTAVIFSVNVCTFMHMHKKYIHISLVNTGMLIILENLQKCK